MPDRKVVYISGPISSDPDYKAKFADAEASLRAAGHIVLNPAARPDGLSYSAYMRLSIAEVDECDTIYMLPWWQFSPGARAEQAYAAAVGKNIIFARR